MHASARTSTYESVSLTQKVDCMEAEGSNSQCHNVSPIIITCNSASHIFQYECLKADTFRRVERQFPIWKSEGQLKVKAKLVPLPVTSYCYHERSQIHARNLSLFLVMQWHTEEASRA